MTWTINDLAFWNIIIFVIWKVIWMTFLSLIKEQDHHKSCLSKMLRKSDMTDKKKPSNNIIRSIKFYTENTSLISFLFSVFFLLIDGPYMEMLDTRSVIWKNLMFNKIGKKVSLRLISHLRQWRNTLLHFLLFHWCSCSDLYCVKMHLLIIFIFLRVSKTLQYAVFLCTRYIRNYFTSR